MKLKELIKEESFDVITTSVNHNHYHFAKINQEGNGKTTETENGKPHIHLIKDWKVLEANNHIHEIKKASRTKR